MIRKVLLLLISMSLLVACASKNNEANNQINELNEEIVRMQYTIVELQNTVDELSMRNEALAAEMSQNSDAVVGLQTESSYMRNEMMVQQGQGSTPSTGTGAVVAGGGEQRPAEESAQTPAQPRIVIIEDPNTIRESLYSFALELYKQGKHNESIEKFREFIEKFPNDTLAGNAQYWIAENFYAMRNWNRALEEFRKVLSQYPRNNKVPDAMLKIGFTQNQMRQRKQATDTLNELVQKHPRSQAASIARQTLSRWK